MTEPLKTVLDIDEARAGVAKLADVASSLLRELVNHATWAFQRCNLSAERHGEIDEDVAPMCLYRWAMETTDAIDELVHQSCGPAMVPLVRALFEAIVSLEYVNREDRGRRGLCWVVGNARKRLRSHQAFLADTEAGRNLAASWYRRFGTEFRPPTDTAESVICNLQALLAKPHLSPINEEFDRLRSKRQGREPNWYSAFGGPPNLKSLSEAIGRGFDYELLYRQWSALAHGQDTRSFVTTHSRGGGAFWSMRNPSTIRDIAVFAAELMLAATRTMLARYRPSESLDFWHSREIRPRIRHLAGLKIEISPKEVN